MPITSGWSRTAAQDERLLLSASQRAVLLKPRSERMGHQMEHTLEPKESHVH